MGTYTWKEFREDLRAINDDLRGMKEKFSALEIAFKTIFTLIEDVIEDAVNNVMQDGVEDALPGSHNDFNVLEWSSVFTDLADGRAAPVNYSINGHDYTMGYYLADGTYPKWSTFVKTIPSPQGNKQKYFAAAQELARKDVERAFGVLQARFAIDERDVNGIENFNYDAIDESSHAPVFLERTTELMEFIRGSCSDNSLVTILVGLSTYSSNAQIEMRIRLSEQWPEIEHWMLQSNGSTDRTVSISEALSTKVLIESKFILTTKLSVEGPLQMKEEYVERVLESPKVSEEAVPEQLKGAFGQAVDTLLQLPVPIRDMMIIRDAAGVANVLTRLGKPPTPIKNDCRAFFCFSEILNIFHFNSKVELNFE
ncbi:hypothetical protein HHK36_017438 [Tetracentron sinense]|uniref:Uncharacterized protein n=1 Tax=Tetracentron sinense TaxID=13715 RepID=A0A835DFR2_TETSI|nr:hypothetical protein HHK36_017438 [Tetracentron sinense]